MPSNPFGKGDPLASGQSGTGAWGVGQGTGGFGGSEQPGPADEYEVVDVYGDPSNDPLATGKAGQSTRQSSLKKAGRKQSVAALQVDAGGAGHPQDHGQFVKKSNVDQKRNWPAKWLPLAHQDISRDVPFGRRSITRMASLVWICTFVAFTYAAAALIAAVALSSAELTTDAWIWVLLLVPIGSFGAWHLWYKRFYWAMVTDSAMSFCIFYTFFMIHIGWCFFAAVAPNFNGDYKESFAGGYTTGFLTATVFFEAADAAVVDKTQERIGAILVVVGAAWWVAVGLLSIALLIRSYRHFRGRTTDKEAARDQAATRA